MAAQALELQGGDGEVQVACWCCGKPYGTAADVAEVLAEHPEGVPSIAGSCPGCLLGLLQATATSGQSDGQFGGQSGSQAGS